MAHPWLVRYYYTYVRIGDKSTEVRCGKIRKITGSRQVFFWELSVFRLYSRAARLVFLPILLLTSRVAVPLTRVKNREVRARPANAHLTFPHLHFLKTALGLPQCVQRYNTTLFGFTFGFAQCVWSGLSGSMSRFSNHLVSSSILRSTFSGTGLFLCL